MSKKSKAKEINDKRTWNNTKCPYEFAKKLLKQLFPKIPDEAYDNKNDKCFCKYCHEKRKDKIIYSRGKPSKNYALPIGWCRFGLKTDNMKCVMNNVWEEWHVAFHGTTKNIIPSIFKAGLLLFKPGDIVIGGNELNIKSGHIKKPFKRTNKYSNKYETFDPNQIFVSPSVKYSGNNVYAKPFKCNHIHDTSRKINIKFAFQLRIRPGSYNIGQETIGAAKNKLVIDKNFSNNELEWYTKETAGIVLYGLLLHVTEITSESYKLIDKISSLWTCELCTFAGNNINDKLCEMCDQPRYDYHKIHKTTWNTVLSLNHDKITSIPQWVKCDGCQIWRVVKIPVSAIKTWQPSANYKCNTSHGEFICGRKEQDHPSPKTHSQYELFALEIQWCLARLKTKTYSKNVQKLNEKIQEYKNERNVTNVTLFMKKKKSEINDPLENVDKRIIKRLNERNNCILDSKCPICLDIFINGVMFSKCGHLICKEHLYDLNGKCPLCGSDFKRNEIIPFSQIMKSSLIDEKFKKRRKHDGSSHTLIPIIKDKHIINKYLSDDGDDDGDDDSDSSNLSSDSDSSNLSSDSDSSNLSSDSEELILAYPHKSKAKIDTKYKCPHCKKQYVKIGKPMQNHIEKEHDKQINDIVEYFNSNVEISNKPIVKPKYKISRLWTCEFCTFAGNDMNDNLCEICLQARPKNDINIIDDVNEPVKKRRKLNDGNITQPIVLT